MSGYVGPRVITNDKRKAPDIYYFNDDEIDSDEELRNALGDSDEDYEDYEDDKGYKNINKISINIFLVIYLLFAIASLTIGVILEIDSTLLANRNYRDYLDTNKFVLYIFIGYQVALILTFSILLYVNNTSIITNEILLTVSSTLFVINIILFTLELFNGRGNFLYVQDYILLFLSAGTLLYFIHIIYGLIKTDRESIPVIPVN